MRTEVVFRIRALIEGKTFFVTAEAAKYQLLLEGNEPAESALSSEIPAQQRSTRSGLSGPMPERGSDCLRTMARVMKFFPWKSKRLRSPD